MKHRKALARLGTMLLVAAFVAGSVVAVPRLVGGERVPAFYTDTQERRNYETMLSSTPGSVEADFGTITDDATGVMHTAYITDRWQCERRCMTVQAVFGGYAVSLPVAYSYAPGSKVFQSAFTPGNIVSLTYWDPKTHMVQKVTAPAGESVTLPAVLRDRRIEEVAVGETVYVTPYAIRMTKKWEQLLLLPRTAVRYEPGGSHYGMSDLTRITRTSGGFVACLPSGYSPIVEDELESDYEVTLAVGC